MFGNCLGISNDPLFYLWKIKFVFVIKFCYVCIMKITLKKKTSNKTEQIKLVTSLLCLVNDIHLSDTQLSVLAYYLTYKISEKTDELLINSKIVKDVSSLRNIKTKLRKLGFLKRTKELYKSYELNLSKDHLNLEDNEIAVLIKIDNT